MTTDNELAGLVKPLQWENTGEGVCANAFGTHAFYWINWGGGDWCISTETLNGMTIEEGFESQALAKSWCDTDYAARILAALDLSELTRLRATVAELTQANAQLVVRVEEARAAIATACDYLDEDMSSLAFDVLSAWLGGAK